MSLPTSRSYDLAGLFSPRGLIVTGITLQVAAALMFWQLFLGFTIMTVLLFPVVGTICMLAAAAIFVWLTRLAWLRNTWLASALYLACIITPSWTFIVIFDWPQPT